MKPVHVQILYSEGCPCTPIAADLVKKTARDMGIEIIIDTISVATEEQARELRFPGSPTVLIQGIDIEPSARNLSTFGMS